MNQRMPIASKSPRRLRCLVVSVSCLLVACAGMAGSAAAATKQLVTGTVYADNSFELWVNGVKVASDPIAFKPFNLVKVSFRASYPMTFAFKAVDYVEDPTTGLEYGNTRAGDGGLIAKFSNGVVTDGTWKSFVVSSAPTNLSACLANASACKVVTTAAPARWTTSTTAAWPAASLYTTQQVNPHVDNFAAVGWGSARFIWGSDLVANNTVLLRTTVRSARRGTEGATRRAPRADAQLGRYTPTSCAARKALFPMSRISDLVKISCSGGKLYVASHSLPHHQVMVGITRWNHNVALPQDYTGTNAWHVPLTPVRSASPVSTMLSNKASGIALNGVPIFAPTRQNGTAYTPANDPHLIGELDTCGGHAGRAEDYHYHYGSPCLIKELGGQSGELVGYGLDGYPILGVTEPSGARVSGLDACNGHYQSGLGYHYHLTTTAPYVMGCYHGVVDTAAQPMTNPMRGPDAPGMVGTITAGKAGLTSGYVRYRHSGGTGSVTWRQNAAGCWTFNYGNSPAAYTGVSSETVCAKAQKASTRITTPVVAPLGPLVCVLGLRGEATS